MKARFLGIMIICTCLVSGTGFSAFAQGQRPGGPPPPPGGTPPGSFPQGGQLPSGPPPDGNGPRAQRHSASESGRASHSMHSSVQFGPVGRWWDNKTVVTSIGLGKEQQRKMDVIFNSNKPAILASYKTFLSEQAKLTALNKDPNVDQARLFATIDAVSQARASLQKATAQMLLQIRQQMSPDQIEKLQKLQ
jgi:Spy/CpxP family protein refolding chaperone